MLLSFAILHRVTEQNSYIGLQLSEIPIFLLWNKLYGKNIVTEAETHSCLSKYTSQKKDPLIDNRVTDCCIRVY